MKEITLKAPATIANFGPGFDIFACALESPFDVIKIKKKQTDSIRIKVSGVEEDIPTEAENNSAGLAASHFFKEMNLSSGLDIEIKKGIKSGAGLGTSGASAAACVYGLNQLFQTHLGYDELIQIARKGEVASGSAPHPDNVAGCLYGGFVLIKEHSPLEIIKINPPQIPLVVCCLKKTVRSTRRKIPYQFPLGEVKKQMSYCASLVHALMSGDLKKIGQAVNKDLISEPVRSQSILKYKEIKQKALRAGAYGCNVSGGGSSLFAVCEKEKTEEIAQIFKDYAQKENLHGDIFITWSSPSGIRETE
ncbi:homoserine kinase [bacterium]|nr:homoserine kinase [bacterium]